MATISRKHFSESDGIKRVDLATENEQRTSRMRDKTGVGRRLLPWIGRFFSDLERAEPADFYRRIGALGRTFMDIETQAFALPV
jgi:TorA maturation chaperone TorD